MIVSIKIRLVYLLFLCSSVTGFPTGPTTPSTTQTPDLINVINIHRSFVDPLENDGITIRQGELIEGDIIVPFGWHPREMPMAAAGSPSGYGYAPPVFMPPAPRTRAENRLRTALPDLTWADRIVPYIIDEGFNTTELSQIRLAMLELTESSGTCITFVPRDQHDNFLFITGRLDGCNSYVGRQGGNQTVSISSSHNCVTKGIIMHELMHALGYLHEHTRIDRDNYIHIILANILPGKEHDFDINREGNLQNISYDYYSIMHYKTNQFSYDTETRHTIEILDPTVNMEEVGQRRYLSEKDAMRIKKLYNCPLKKCSYPHTLNNGIIQVKNTTVGSSIRYSCTGQGHVLIGAQERTCLYDGKWSGSTPICFNNTTVVSYCNFEDASLCGWTQDTTDEADWSRRNSHTPSENTGPLEDHTLQNSRGFYLYLEGTGLNPGVKSRLVSQQFQGIMNGCLMFWYHMYGVGMGELDIYLKSEGNVIDKVWTISGNQGNSWKLALITDLSPSVPFQVVFEATRGSLDTTDIAIDDVIIGECQNIITYKEAVIRELKEGPFAL